MGQLQGRVKMFNRFSAFEEDEENEALNEETRPIDSTDACSGTGAIYPSSREVQIHDSVPNKARDADLAQSVQCSTDESQDNGTGNMGNACESVAIDDYLIDVGA